MSKSGIYQITNTLNNNVYIGSSVNIPKRKTFHFWQLRTNSHPNGFLQNSFNKYGESNFIFEVIELCDKSAIVAKEQELIDTYIAAGRTVFNICKIAGGVTGRIVSQLTKDKISAANKGRKTPEWQKELLRTINTGKPHSEEHKAKIRNTQLGKSLSDEWKQKISEGNKGKPKSEQHRIALSLAHKGVKRGQMSDERRLRLSEASKNRPKISEETRRKLSESHKGKKQSIETIEKRKESIKRKCQA